MPVQHSSAPAHADQIKADQQPLRVLLVDRDASLVPAIQSCGGTGGPVEVAHTRSLLDARRRLAEQSFDLVVVEADMPGGSGLELAHELAHRPEAGGGARAVVISARPNLDEAMEAIRAGACDYLSRPMDLERIHDCVHRVRRRRGQEQHRDHRLHRLRRLCRRLNVERHEVGRQVEVLSSDLVGAYQELAEQMHQVAKTSEYAAVIRDELDLEQLLRRTLEYLLTKAGPTNAAVFLPSSMEEYSLGGYVNYDCTAQAADMLLEHLADVLAPRVAAAEDPAVHITDNQTLDRWIGDDAIWLSDNHVLAFAARHDDEPLAVVTLFRDGGEPFSHALTETCRAIGPMLGQALARVIRVHHRHLPGLFDIDEGDAVA